MRFFPRTNIDFIGKRHIWYTVSASLILLGLITMAIRGLNYGIDFVGGTELTLEFNPVVHIGQVRSALDKIGHGDAEIKTFGAANQLLIRVKASEQGANTSDQIMSQLKSTFPSTQIQLLQENKIGPQIGQELRRDAVMAIFYSLIAILIYVSLRFQFIYAVGAVIALFHDVLITLGAVAIFGWLLPWLNLEINQTMVAAFLTLVAYSMNDTVVIFDRIRENSKIYKGENMIRVMNRSINDTLSRTIITSGTAFAVLLVLLIFGGEVTRGFAFAMLIGVITGTYSSIYVASAIVVDYNVYVKKVDLRLTAAQSPVLEIEKRYEAAAKRA
ncbi:MAG: protein translocase subunit SecF [Bacteroidetes bacterium]|nr:protein translocase subunit SecF [Bacteroidota bacterium]MCL5739184.1 protein translocase subunit SecF [Bacteroidota bacterium]